MRKLLRTIARHKALWYLSRGLMIAVAVLGAAIISSATLDIGPVFRPTVEAILSDQVQRPVHVGRMTVNIVSGLLIGRVQLEDLVIEGRVPTDRPFFTARQLRASIDWWPAVARRPNITVTSVDLEDWQMLVEKWKDADSFPRLKRSDRPRSDPRPFTVTVRSFRGTGGQFKYEDHETPWSVLAPDIALSIGNLPKYSGRVTSKGGLIAIQDYVPMWSDLDIRFVIDGDMLRLTHIDMETDGAKTTASGELDMAHWPEQKYTVKTHLHFQRMRELFFAKEEWPLRGDADFAGVFHLFKGGHDLSGRFTSDLAGVYDYRFPSLFGSLHWNKDLFDVWDAGSRFSGGAAAFTFSIKPLGSGVRPTARFDASYTDVDLSAFTDFQELPGLRFAGRATGRNIMEWPIGRTSARQGAGQIAITPPPGTTPMTASLAAAREADAGHTLHAWGPFAPIPLVRHLPIAAGLTYRFDPDQVYIDEGRFATEQTHVAFSGSTAWASDTALQFHVTSGDWQESQLVLAGIMTDFGSPTGSVTFGGRGEFDGTMTGPFRRPRVAGLFLGEDLRAWDTIWGEGSAQIVVENNYVTVSDGQIGRDGSEIRTDGRFSLGYPRRDRGQELDAQFRVKGRDLGSLRHAFEIDDYPVTGLLSGEFQLRGEYEHPFGSGSMTIEQGTAYGEPFDRGTAALTFDGTGVRLNGMTIAKGSGAVTGAAYVGWEGTYSFDADARDLPMDQVALFAYPEAHPTGALAFTAGGNGLFENPSYDVTFRIDNLAVADEPIGLVKGTLALRGDEVRGELDIASPRLRAIGTGRIALRPRAESELNLRFLNSSLDPYLRMFAPQMLPYATATASGTVRIVGDISDVDRLLVEGVVDILEMRLFDYEIRNAGPMRLALDRNVVRVNEFELVGEDTRLKVGGTIGLRDQAIAVQASGEANLGILQGFFSDVRGSGRAEITATASGSLREPQFSGNATIVDGRVRHLSLPNALDAINGTIHVDSNGIRLDDVAAILGDGRVQFGGRIGLDGYLPGELNVIVRGEDMHLRYPAGVRSTVDAELTIRGNVKAAMLGGIVTVKSALWNQRIDLSGGLLRFGDASEPSSASAAPALIPLTYDIEVLVPGTLRVENNLLRLSASADLQLRGTYERPMLFGRADVDRGQVTFEGRRYLVTKGAIEFTNPIRIDPFFDVEAETRVRVPFPGQTYRVTVRAAGTMDRLQPTFESDPPLPATDVLALLFSDVRRDTNQAEIRALQNPNELERDILTSRATQLLANPLSEEVGRVVEQAFGVDTFQLSPSLIDPYSQSTTTRVNPSARVTLGKRVSERAFLTFSRSLNSSISDQILLLEYDASDRLSWILSRNEDQTYAVEVRVRHVF
ncbi:MAG: translocation/assembly module TamB [Acidobacteria bacterium]|nr:translocation/assembly module TamB [Acidobacteriota bacterium]